MTSQAGHAETPDAAWKGLCRVGGVAALVAALVFRRWLGAELSLLGSLGLVRFQPVPAQASVLDWFALLQAHRLIGLTLRCDQRLSSLSMPY
jgi:hypothetical protein